MYIFFIYPLILKKKLYSIDLYRITLYSYNRKD